MTNTALKVIQLTDPHLHTDREARLRDVNTWQSFERVLAHMQTHHWPADVIVMTGDLAQDEAASTYQMLAERMRQIDTPVLFLPGNHDNPEAMHAHLNQGRLSCAPRHQFGQWDLHLLSTHVPGHVHGELNEHELNQLRQGLNLADSAPYSALFMHHPAFEVGPDWLNETRLRNADALLAITRASHRVRALFCGHVHLDHETQDQGVLLASSPSTGAQFHPRNRTYALDTRGPAYRKIRLFGDGHLESAVVWLEPTDFAAE